MSTTLTDAEVDKVLERFDQTKPAMQRKIVATTMAQLMFLTVHHDEVMSKLDKLADLMADSLELRVRETPVVEWLNDMLRSGQAAAQPAGELF